VYLCVELLTSLLESQQRTHKKAGLLDPVSKVRKQQRQQQRRLQAAEAALSLLLTVTKLPQVMQSAEMCTCMATCIRCLSMISAWEPSAAYGQSDAVQSQQRQQRQQQQQQQQQQLLLQQFPSLPR
jgi:hypothetical protein